MTTRVSAVQHKVTSEPWLRHVPEHWRIGRIKDSVASAINGTWGQEPDGEHDVRCVRVADFDRERRRIHDKDATLRAVSRDEFNRLAITNGDLLLEKSGGGEKSPVGFVVLYDRHEQAICSNFIARIRLREDMDPRFWTYLHGAYYNLRLTARSIKQSTGIQNLDQTSYFNEVAAFPPYEEQVDIANFLDRETGEIDEFIRDQEELIQLLNEYRAATISQAVTKGLDPEVPMKSSGNQWIDEVPASWTVNRFSRCVRVVSGQVDPRSERFIDMVLIAPNHVEAGTGRLLEMETAREQGADSGKYLVAKGQVVYSKIRPALSKVIIAPVACLCSADMYALDGATRDLTNEFIHWYLLGRPFTNYAIDQSARVAMPKLNQDTLGAAPICYPSLEEQKRICAFLEQETGEIDSAIRDANKAIGLLIERRASLISAAVTGKIDVRERVRGA